VVIENQTSTAVTVQLEGAALGDAEPGMSVRKKEIPGGIGPMLITAKNRAGQIVFSKRLSFREMEYLGKGVYRVVITEADKVSPASDNVNGRSAASAGPWKFLVTEARMGQPSVRSNKMLKPKSPQASFYGSYLYDRIVPAEWRGYYALTGKVPAFQHRRSAKSRPIERKSEDIMT
jgi:hypothetical protein